jgi:hypothetical protein
MYSTANNIATAEICSWLTAQGADPKLFLKLLRTTGSQASVARLEEFMQRNNNNGGALSNSYKDIRQALEVAAGLQIPMPLLSMANQIQEMGRASGFTRLNSPAAMGELFGLITSADLSGATMLMVARGSESRWFIWAIERRIGKFGCNNAKSSVGKKNKKRLDKSGLQQ